MSPAGAVRERVGADVNDRLLAGRLVEGDEAAMGEVFDQQAPFVYALALRITGSRQAAEDVTQDVLLALWQHPDRFDPDRGTLKAFLGTLAHRRAVDHIRREEARRRREERLRTPEADHVDLADAAVRRFASRAVHAVIAELPPAQREAIELAYFGGHTYRQVAELLGIPEGTAKSRLRLALRRVADLLNPELSEQWT